MDFSWTPDQIELRQRARKVAAEAVMSLYAARYGIDAVSCRIGSFLPQPETARNLSTWLSPDDCVRMVDAALTATAPGSMGQP